MSAFNYCNIGMRDGYFLVTQKAVTKISEICSPKTPKSVPNMFRKVFQKMFPKVSKKCHQKCLKKCPEKCPKSASKSVQKLPPQMTKKGPTLT